MNAQINKLFAQALDQAVPETWTTLTPQQVTKLMEKFAQLLVRECADIADSADENACEWIGGNILTHFGIDQ